MEIWPLNKRVARLVAALLLFPSMLCICSQERQARAVSVKPIVVEVHRTGSGLTFKLEPDPAPGKDILCGLSILVEQRGRDYPVVALVDDTAKINDIEQVPGIAAKAGFTDVRTFIVKNKIGMMAEIKFFPAVPISKIPPSESICTSP